jgi:hypothetical protein
MVRRASTRRRSGSKRGRNRRLKITRYPIVAPGVSRAQLSYGDVWSLASGGATSWARNDFKLNSLYDPDGTGVGGQPSGFAPWMGLYTRYRVVKCVVDVTFQNRVAWPVLAGFTATNDLGIFPTTGVTAQQFLLEDTQPISEVVTLANAGCDHAWAHVRRSVDVAKVYRRIYATDDDFYGRLTTDPVRMIWCEILAVSADHTVNSMICDAIVRLEFDCEFSQPAIAIQD